MSDKTQELQAQVQALKIRLFDTQEVAQQAQVNFEQLTQVLSRIASIVGVQPGEDGQIQIEDIVTAVGECAGAHEE